MKIGFLGTGLMGLPMATRLMDAGFEVVAYNRTASKLAPLKAAGVQVMNSPEEVVRASDAVITMVTNAEAIADLVLGDRTRAALPGRTIIQMSTIAPQQSQDLCQTVRDAGGDYFEAPVLGSVPQAEQGTLILMVGATPEQFAQWSEVLQCFGKDPLLVGDVGQAAALKLAMNQLIGSLTTAFALSLGFVQAHGIDVEQFMGIVRQSALYAPTFDKKLDRMLDRNFEHPNFPTKHLLKDMELFTDAARSQGLDTRLTESVSQVVTRAIEMGLADADYSALFSAVCPPGDR